MTQSGAEDLQAGIAALGSRLSAIRLRRTREGSAVAGVCSGIASTLDVDVTLVRLVFALLALAGGSGIVLYGAAWILIPDEEGNRPRRQLEGAVLLVVAIVLGVRGLGLDDTLVWPAALVAVGIALASWGELPLAGGPTRLRRIVGAALVILGGSLFLGYGDPFGGGALVPPGAVVAALLLIVAPWLWRLAREREAERAGRIRSQERAEMAARVHDSVLQTLALIQREAGDPRRVATLARRQERELRTWLYREPGPVEGESLVVSIEAAAAEVEEVHGVRVEVVASGDVPPLDDDLRALVLAAREAMTNAAKFSGAEEVSVYVEAGADGATVFVRDRGVGFERGAVPADRRGLSESIEGRLARHGGGARIANVPGEGTEVELTIGARP